MSEELAKDHIRKSGNTDSHEITPEALELEKGDRVGRTDRRSRLGELFHRLDRWGLEVNGIERISPQDRTQKSTLDVFTMWLGANSNVVTFSLGTLGTGAFGLGFRDSVITIVVFNVFSTIPVAYCSTFGARTGLRQMVFSRFAFGYWTCMIPGLLNVIACLGWATVNCIVGAQTLRAVSSTHPLPIWGGVIITAIATLIPSFFGYKYVHMYERHSWIAPVIVFLIILGEARHFMNDGSSTLTGKTEIASVLSFGASVVGYSLGWVSFAADYTAHLPEDSSAYKIFFSALFGNLIPMILLQTLGAAMMTTLERKSSWNQEYQNNGMGGLLAAGLSPLNGFGRFLTAILGLSVVACNIPMLYSLALTVQIFGKTVASIPRPLITFGGTAIYVALALIGERKFESFLDTFLVLLGYWAMIYCVILLEEHLIFRRGRWSRYSLSDVDVSRSLPPGFASGFALCCGVAGAIIGMAQKWYVGPIGRLIGSDKLGGDIGFELSCLFTLITYPPLRYLEKKRYGR